MRVQSSRNVLSNVFFFFFLVSVISVNVYFAGKNYSLNFVDSNVHWKTNALGSFETQIFFFFFSFMDEILLSLLSFLKTKWNKNRDVEFAMVCLIHYNISQCLKIYLLRETDNTPNRIAWSNIQSLIHDVILK